MSYIIRIIELDFVIIIGLSAIVIGFAEGYSILAIFRSITKGVSIAKTGRVATQSPPKIIVITTQLFYLLAWMSILWDKFLIIIDTLRERVGLNLPDIDYPEVFEIISRLSIDLMQLGNLDFLLVLTILIVPFYFIITSSFKFLSVGLVLDRIEEDVSSYILLISSAFILIVINILNDISQLPIFLGEHRPFLPFTNLQADSIIRFAANIFDVLESIAFYIGVIVSLIFAVGSIKDRVGNKNNK